MVEYLCSVRDKRYQDMKKLYVFSGILLAIAASSCSHRDKQEVDDRQNVKVDTVRSATEQSALQYPGKVKAADDINIAFRVSGTLNKIHVTEGTTVRKGQLLAELDPTDYQVQLDATEAEYNQIKNEAERVMGLYQEGGTTASANDKALYGLKQITAKRQHHKDQLAYTRLYAPFDGRIQKRLFKEHETVGAGMPVISLISNGTPEVEINLPAAEYIRRAQFTGYHCTFDIYPDHIYPLEFISVTPKANANQLYTMRLRLQAQGMPLPSPGMNTMVTIYCDTTSNVPMTVPSGAIRHEDGKTCVFIYNKNKGCVHSHKINIVRMQTDGTAIVTSDEIRPGDCVVASGARYIKDGEKVKPLPATSKTNVGGML